MTLQKLLSDIPSLHSDEKGLSANYAINEKVLTAIFDLLKPGMHTLETGSGHSTIVFAMAGAKHLSISPYADEQERIREYMRAVNITSQVQFITDGSDRALPALQLAPGSVDFVLIDGAHRFPFACIDFHYTGLLLKIGGILCLDDVDMPSVRILYKYLLGEKEWRLTKKIKHTAFFTRTAPTIVYSDWQGQQMNSRFKKLGLLKAGMSKPVKKWLKIK